MSSLENWTNVSNVSVCADDSPNNITWSGWDANQRDLFVLDHTGNIVLHQNIGSGLPNDLDELIIELVTQISDCDPNLMCGGALTCIDGLLYPTTCGPDNCDDPIDTCSDCDPNLICGEALTCVDGLLYPTTCGPDNCDEPIDTCSDDECIDGEIDNTNPCNPRECYDGQWIEIIIDCAEWFGVPCDNGIYIAPPEGVCCSTCELYGDVNNDDIINVVDIVLIVSFILGNDIPEDNQYIVSDINNDGNLNVVDIVMLVNLILG
tara:strand:- start:209 stop:997 length:789 start_codon:yes stop_codon:yes gene_type:complete